MNTTRTGPAMMLGACLLGAGALVIGSPGSAKPLGKLHRHQDPEAQQVVRQAQHAVDRAWEAFHKAALGGTLASPAVQAEAERALHEARTLLVKARDAADQGNREDLDPLIARIHALADRAIRESREQKE